MKQLKKHGWNIKKLKNLGISFKLLISMAFLILISVFFVSYFSYIQYTKDNEIQAANRVHQIIDQVSLNIDTYVNDLFNLSTSPYYDDNVMDSLEQNVHNSQIKQLNKSRSIEGFLNEMMIFPRNDILRVEILTDDVYMSDRYNSSINSSIDFHSFSWYKKALADRNPIFLPAHLEELVNNPKFTVFSVVTQMRSTRNTDKVLGVIKVDANFTGIQQICDRVNMGNNGGLYIIDENKNIIYSSISDIPYTEFFNKVKSLNGSYANVKYRGTTYMLSSTVIPRANWTVVAVNSLSEINKNAKNIRNNSFKMAVIFSFLAILVLAIFIQWFLRPLLDIVNLMKKVQNGNLYVKFHEKRHDEIGYLGSSFNTMVERIKYMLDRNTNLVKEVYEANYLQKEAQINALFSQIRPHFIYNTLNMISMEIQCNKPDDAVENINKLSSILRGMANMDKDVTVQFEAELLDAYLGIQNSRYAGRLEYSIDIDKSLYSYIIPALILQPAVENAVVHGCEAKKDKTFIKVYSKEEADRLIFIVEDTGIGMDEKTLSEFREKLDNDAPPGVEIIDSRNKGSGIGLVNVNRRIKIRYGKEYGIKIDSALGKGTTVEVILPKHEFGGKGKNV